MKTERNIFIAFILNLSFSVLEFAGGLFTGSVAIISDAVHDLGDAAGIGLSYILEKKSRKAPDKRYTYGYTGYSVIGSLITTLILLIGSAAVILNSVKRIITPSHINYDGMIVFAVIGIAVNLAAAFFTRDGGSLNQKAVNLHMLEDVLGWVVVFLGAIVMRFTDITLIDPLMSIAVAVFIAINAVGNLKKIVDLFLEKVPQGIDVDELKEHLINIDGVIDAHHIHVRSLDGQSVCATMHIVTSADPAEIKAKVREELKEHGITHATLELEAENESCGDRQCHVTQSSASCCHCHHH